MSFAAFDDTTAWSTPPAHHDAADGDIVAQAVRKERVLRDILAAQDDLRTLLARVAAVQGEVHKLTTGNRTLQMYIDNLTKQLARR